MQRADKDLCLDLITYYSEFPAFQARLTEAVEERTQAGQIHELDQYGYRNRDTPEHLSLVLPHNFWCPHSHLYFARTQVQHSTLCCVSAATATCAYLHDARSRRGAQRCHTRHQPAHHGSRPAPSHIDPSPSEHPLCPCLSRQCGNCGDLSDNISCETRRTNEAS